MLGYIFNLGVPELMIILVVVLIFFGAGKLPQVLGQMGKGVKEFKKGMKEKDDGDLLLEGNHTVERQEEKITDVEEIKS
jgi:sec-independent protein translocase protein TatA